MLNSDSANPGAAPVDRPPSYCLLIAKEEMKKDLKREPSKSSLPTYEEALEIEEKTPLNPIVWDEIHLSWSSVIITSNWQFTQSKTLLEEKIVIAERGES